MCENKKDNVTSGVLTVKLGWTEGLSLPDPTSENWRERWRPYVIAEYEGFQLSSEEIGSIPTKGAISWVAWYQPFRFDLSPCLSSSSSSSELILSLFVTGRDFDTTKTSSSWESEPQRIPLGLVKVNPFLIGSGTQKVDVQNGTGSVQLEISITQKEILPLNTRDDWKIRRRNEGASGCDLIYVEKKDSRRGYGMEVIDTPRSVHGVETKPGINMAPSLNLCSGIQHPFIAPLKFTFISVDGQLELLSPLGSGGYLSDHAQRERRFGITKARYYAAELVCILEYLHGKNIIVGSFKLENILLDSSGHVSLCKPSLFGLEPSKDRDCILPGVPPYPTPEDILSNRGTSRAGDWWSLGVILYELLTGAPPFYHKDEGERRNKIIHHDLQLSMALPLNTKDILTKLLDKDPTRRLGVNGVAEVKAHPFFDGLNWDECIQQKLETPFKPHDATVVFWREPYTYEVYQGPTGELQEIGGVIFERMGNTDFLPWRPIDFDTGDKATSKANDNALKGEWDLIWEPSDKELYFQNRSSNHKVIANSEAVIQGETSAGAPEHPTERQKEEALAAALRAGYSNHIFSQLLSYSLNLNILILDFDHYPTRQITPLEWAVELERPDLVHLFLDHGAHADFTIPSREGPALIRAVTQKSPSLVETLVQRTTDRVSRTRALALAVEQQDTQLATILLAYGVHCDFEESDRPLPTHPFLQDHDSDLSRVFEAEDLTPPLVRAARLGNLTLVKLLLEHSADANVAYHDLGGKKEYSIGDSKIPAKFSCGRAVQIAMEMGYPEVARLLVDAGADIDLPQPVWLVLGHVCQPVPRVDYLEIMDGLKEIVTERGGS